MHGVCLCLYFFFFFQAEDGIRDDLVTGVQTCALPILAPFILDQGIRQCASLSHAFQIWHARSKSFAYHFFEKASWRVSVRSEERRVGKECRSRWSPYH